MTASRLQPSEQLQRHLRHRLSTLALLLIVAIVSDVFTQPKLAAKDLPYPNIVVILADDKYYDSLGNAAEEAENTEKEGIDAFCKSPGIAANSVEFEVINYTLLQQVCFYRT